MSAPTIVLVHGAGHTSDDWCRAQDHLRHASLAVDLPGRKDRPGDLTSVTIEEAAASVTRVIKLPASDALSPYAVAAFMEMKTVWHPVGR